MNPIFIAVCVLVGLIGFVCGGLMGSVYGLIGWLTFSVILSVYFQVQRDRQNPLEAFLRGR